jgi:hypothetical protein
MDAYPLDPARFGPRTETVATLLEHVKNLSLDEQCCLQFAKAEVFKDDGKEGDYDLIKASLQEVKESGAAQPWINQVLFEMAGLTFPGNLYSLLFEKVLAEAYGPLLTPEVFKLMTQTWERGMVFHEALNQVGGSAHALFNAASPGWEAGWDSLLSTIQDACAIVPTDTSFVKVRRSSQGETRTR